MDLSALTSAIDRYRQQKEDAARDAAVLIPLVDGESGPEVLLEVRAMTLAVQPGEVCLPGGSIEAGETPLEAAVRETCEELCIAEGQIDVVGNLGIEPGPTGRSLHVFVGTIENYEGTFSADEVDSTFTLPLSWLASHEPSVYEVGMRPEFPNDFPWELIPQGREYKWRSQKNRIPFYLGTNPMVWGATARVLMRFAQLWVSA
jgi:8-oxo-dGTP pyrophosphatase MutT (NUDIX family)